MSAFRVLHLDETPPLETPWEGVPSWTPVRRLLGIEAFGVNLQTAAEAGDPVIEPHDEADDAGGGHQELYVVLTGAASVTADGETFDVRPGSLVFFGDPAVRRAAVATAPGTTILAVGAEPGVPFAPSSWEERWARELGAP